MGKLSFRQIHLDFHTSEKIAEIGQRFDGKDFARTLKEAGVESINLFARCHHGRIYYDTEFPARHPGLKINLLEEQIEACHEMGIKTPVYITVGWDEYSARNHPEWISRREDGRAYGTATAEGTGEPLLPGWKTLCFNTPYVDYLEAQTIEVLKKLRDKADGVWFDIVWQDPCCCNYCMEGMEKSGLDPSSREDRMKYAELVVVKFKRRITETVRKYNKTCPIFFNEGHIGPDIKKTLDCYTHIEIESLGSGEWGYEHFPITVRYAKNLGKEYIAMTGKFHKSWADFSGFKNQPALEYECFSAIAHGAKCSVGDQLHPTGELNPATYELIGNVYHQIEEKEPYLDDVTAVCDIAVFIPEALSGSGKKLSPSLRGAYRMLEEAHHQFDIIDEKMDFNKYRVIILPDVITLKEELKMKLEAYTAGGGQIIASYASGMNENRDSFLLKGMGAQYVKEAEYSPDFIFPGLRLSEGLLKTEYVMYERGMWVKAERPERILAEALNPYFNRDYNHFCSHCHTPADKKSEYPAVVKGDNVIYFAHPIFQMYHKHGARVYKQLVLNALNLQLPDRMIYTNAPTTAHININYQAAEGRYVVHLIHYIPERRFLELDTIEDIIPLYNVELKIRLDKEPGNVYCAPKIKRLAFQYENGYVSTVVPEVIGHQMLVIEE